MIFSAIPNLPTIDTILLHYNFIAPLTTEDQSFEFLENNQQVELIGTFVNNLMYYGYALDTKTFLNLAACDKKTIVALWKTLKPALEEVTGANRNMDQFVVYKNFPKEVLDLDRATYLTHQMLIYSGVKPEALTQTPQPREPLAVNEIKYKILTQAGANEINTIFNQLLAKSAAWTPQQLSMIQRLIQVRQSNQQQTTIDIDAIGFKQNALMLTKDIFSSNEPFISFKISNATDVYRIAQVLSGANPASKKVERFKSFNRSTRKELLGILENAGNLMEDIQRNKKGFKYLLKALHPGDFKQFPKVLAAQNQLYNDQINSLNSELEQRLLTKDPKALEILAKNPGEFVRRFHHCYELFPQQTIDTLTGVAPELTTKQLLNLSSYVNHTNQRSAYLVRPNSQWHKTQLVANDKTKIQTTDLAVINQTIDNTLGERLAVSFPEGIFVDPKLSEVKLSANDQTLAPYGRGTTFDIPAEATFIRTASFWESGQGFGHSTWFDNGWNFFDDQFNSKGTCCWNASPSTTGKQFAVFSGDPSNANEMKGRACQMIDLYLDRMKENGVRYAAWNILAYSHIPFNEVPEVLGTLQWGENPLKGKLFEPSRAQMVFPIKDASESKLLCILDVHTRQLIYTDMSILKNVSSASLNAKSLENGQLKAIVEHLNQAPSIFDLLKHAPKPTSDTAPIALYTDQNKDDLIVNQDADTPSLRQAYVFKKENPLSSYEAIDFSHLLDQTHQTLGLIKQLPIKKHGL